MDFSIGYTDGCINVTTLQVKHYNDLLERRRSGRARDEVTYFYVEDLWVANLLSLISKQNKLFFIYFSSPISLQFVYMMSQFRKYFCGFDSHLLGTNSHEFCLVIYILYFPTIFKFYEENKNSKI